MRSGVELLQAARSMSEAEVALTFGHAGPSSAQGIERAALVAALLSSFTPADAPLIRQLTRAEITAVNSADAGCGDVLLACCWLLFRLGYVEDSELVWRAKEINFDSHSYIDSVFLIPQGAQATAEFARSQGLSDLVTWVEGDWLRDPEEHVREWRTGSFFATVPPAEAPAAELAAWLRQ
ncbi:hypothetical protein ABN028_35025 [Actinopolymorpha sp. B17G11]|uniref:hypothetical protein n=1 Tax=Actinopolymorpha sp. B17G11 TaxID=3160861 RepID=UPI0032E4EB93